MAPGQNRHHGRPYAEQPLYSIKDKRPTRLRVLVEV